MIALQRYRLKVVSGLIAASLIGAWISGIGSFRDILRESAFDRLLPWLVDSSRESSVVVVDIDRDTLARYGSWPWPRSIFADLVRSVAQAEPAVVGLDILLDNRADKQTDSGNAIISEAARTVSTVFGLVLDDKPSETRLPNTPLIVRSRPALPEIWTAMAVIGPPPEIAQFAAGLGAIALLPDADGRIRRVPLMVATAGVLRPGLAVELVRVGLQASAFLLESTPPLLRIGPLAIAIDADAQFRVVPSTEAHWQRRTISAATVLTDQASRARLTGRAVLIGSSAPEVGGLRATPVSAATPSVQIQADAMEMLVGGPRPRRPVAVSLVESVFAIAFSLFAVAVTLCLRPLSAALLMLGACLTWAAASAALFWSQSLLLDPVGVPGVAIAFFSLFSIAAHADNERRARALQQRFEQHLAPAVVRRIMENPDLVRLEGESREITALFTDVEGFTSMTERAEPRKLIALLDQYLDEITVVITAHGGMVEKIVGDGIHAIFNAPLDLPDHPRHAFECAIAILEASERVRSRTLARELGLGGTRIGIETGPVILGDVGGRRKLDYTAHGTAMNTAARLEAANKEFGSSVCIGPIAATRLDPKRIRSLGILAVRGLTASVEVFTVADAPGTS